MRCPSCQTENLESAKFCQECGQPIPSELICSRCNHKNPLQSKFCIQCGQSLISDQTLSTQSVPQYGAPAKISPEPAYFAGGRYQVRKLLGEGGRKRVYLAHDSPGPGCCVCPDKNGKAGMEMQPSLERAMKLQSE